MGVRMVDRKHGMTFFKPREQYSTWTSRGSSPRSFQSRTHYTAPPRSAAVSAAIVFAESAVIRATACTLADELVVLRAQPAPRAA